MHLGQLLTISEKLQKILEDGEFREKTRQGCPDSKKSKSGFGVFTRHHPAKFANPPRSKQKHHISHQPHSLSLPHVIFIPPSSVAVKSIRPSTGFASIVSTHGSPPLFLPFACFSPYPSFLLHLSSSPFILHLKRKNVFLCCYKMCRYNTHTRTRQKTNTSSKL